LLIFHTTILCGSKS